MKRIKYAGLAFLLLLSMLLAGACTPAAPGQPSQSAPAPSVSAESTAAPPEESGTITPVWENTDSVGCAVDAPLQDDFHGAVNRQWIANTTLDDTQVEVSAFTERNSEVQEQMLALIQDESQESHEAKLLRKLYRALMDMDTRNSLGIEPILPLVKDIRNIKTMDDLTVYLADQKNKIVISPMQVIVQADWKDSAHNAVYIGSADFSLDKVDEYSALTAVGQRKKEAATTFFQKMLIRVGYSEKEAAALNASFEAWESEVASACTKDDPQQSEAEKRENYYNPMSLDQLKKLSPNFPVEELLKDYTDAGVTRFILTEPKWLEKLDAMYTEENLEGFRAFLLYNMLHAAAGLLDQECMDLLDEYNSTIAGSQVKSDLREISYALCSGLLDMAMGKLYAENYVAPETKQQVTDIVNQVVAVYRERLENNDWLGKETRTRAIEKLDALKIRVAYPDDWSLYDYSDLDFQENDNLLDYMLMIRAKNQSQKTLKAVAEVNKDMWPMSPQTVNACYLFTDNSINIPAGILGGVFYDPSASREAQMGAIGMIIGHEITHGFDTTGSTYDKDGNLKNWWTDEDQAAFQERTKKVAEFFGKLEVLPGVYVDGYLTLGETVADLGAVSCMLEIAKEIDDFDYKTFFMSYAQIWRAQRLPNMTEVLVQTDPHPPGYLRTNATVQQMQEFYDTFGITEQDGMYLPPEERLTVW